MRHTALNGSKAAHIGSSVMELGDVVRFSSHPRPFLVTETYCSNPDCHCNEVFLNFTEVSDFSGISPLASLDYRGDGRAPSAASWLHLPRSRPW